MNEMQWSCNSCVRVKHELGKVFTSWLKVVKQLLTHNGNSEKATFALNDPDTTASKPVLEIKPVLTVQPTLNSALLTYGLSMLPVTLNSSKDRCGLCIEAGCVPCCTQNSCITAAYNIYYRRRRNSQMLLRMGLVPVLYRKDARLLVVNFATTENRKFAISKWIYTT